MILESGASLVYVSKRLGHKTIKPSADTYLSITEKMKKTNLKKFAFYTKRKNLNRHEIGTIIFLNSYSTYKTLGQQRFIISYPMLPSISNLINLFISTAYSIGSSLVNGSMKPMTIISVASASVRPRLIR